MARVNLRCGCGFFFAVTDTQLEAGVKCPSCLRPVSPDGPPDASVPPPPRIDDVKVAAPSKLTFSRRTMALAGGGFALLVLGTLWFLASGDEGRKDEGSRSTPRRPLFGDSDPGKRGSLGSSLGTSPTTAPSRPDEGKGAARPGDRPPGAGAPASPASGPAAPGAGAAAEGSPSSGLANTPVVPDALARIREMMALPAWYQEILFPSPADHLRAASVAQSGRGTPQDVEFLQTLIASPRLKGVLEEQALIQESLDRLKKDAVESLPVDRVVMTDGRIMNGRIAEEAPETVRFERKMGKGVGGTMNLKRAEIKELQKGRGLGGEFRTKWDQAQKGASQADLVSLLNWCHENALAGQAQLVAFLILQSEPGHPAARSETGLPANPVQTAMELAAQGGGIPYQGRTWLPKELKEKLKKEGFALFGGAWYARKERIIAVPNLFRYETQAEKPVLISPSTAVLNHDTEILWKMVQEPGTTISHPVSEVKSLRRFYAPTMGVTTLLSKSSAGAYKDAENHIDQTMIPAGRDLTGEVFISVPLGAPILEGTVMTAAETKQGGTVTVYQINGPERIRLYGCKAKEEESHPLADAIRGETKVDLVAVITLQSAYIPKSDRREVYPPRMDQKLRIVQQKGLDLVIERQIPDYRAVLFPSQSNTYDVFRLKVIVGEPAPLLDRLFADSGHSDLLRQ